MQTAVKLVTVLLILEAGWIINVIAGRRSGNSNSRNNDRRDSYDDRDSKPTDCTLNKLNCEFDSDYSNSITCVDLEESNSSIYCVQMWERLLSDFYDSMIDTGLMYIGEHAWYHLLC